MTLLARCNNLVAATVYLCASAWAGIAWGQADRGPLVPEPLARQHGLVRAWWRQAPVDSTRDQIENITLQGDTLYLQTRRGTISALDSETGHVRWTQQIGSPELVTSAVGASDTFAGVINGRKLYVMTHKDGEIAFERTLKNVPGAGPALSDTHVFAPATNGSIEAYQIDDVKKPPLIYNSTGRAMNQPFCAGDVLAWTTDRGLFYVAKTQPLAPRFRVETYEPIIVGPGYKAPFLYVGSTAGHVLKVHEVTGSISWKAVVGEPVDARPTVLGDRLFVSTRRGGVRCILAETKAAVPKVGKIDGRREGEVLWHAPSAGRLLAGSEKRLYCLDELARMTILRRDDGGFVSTMPLPGAQLVVLNDVTDRIYVATRHGTVQCLHEVGLVKPLMHRRGPDAKEVANPAKPKPSGAAPAPITQPKEDAGFGEEGLVPEEKKGPEKQAEPAKGAEGGAEGGAEPAPKADEPAPEKKDAGAGGDVFGM